MPLGRVGGVCGRDARYRQRDGWDQPNFRAVRGGWLFDRDEQALPWAGSQVGIVVAPDEEMRLVAIGEAVVADSVGDPVDTLTAVGGVAFWFCSTDRSSAVNRMATLNLFAATKVFGVDRAFAVWACVDYRRGWARQAYRSVTRSIWAA